MVSVVPEESEDMWHAYNLITEGDSVRGSTIRCVSIHPCFIFCRLRWLFVGRKVNTESATGTTSAMRVRTTLTLAVENVDFDTQAGMLRVKGRNTEENDYVKVP